MDAVAAPGAVLLLFAFAPGRRGPPRGIAQAELLDRFPTWELRAATPADDVSLPRPLRNAAPTWYRLAEQ